MTNQNKSFRSFLHGSKVHLHQKETVQLMAINSVRIVIGRKHKLTIITAMQYYNYYI